MSLARLALPLLLAAGLSGSSPLSAAETVSRSFALSAEFSPTPESAKQYRFQAQLTDLETKEVLANPSVIAERGKSPKLRFAREEFEYAFEISLSETGHMGSCLLTVTRAGKVVHQQKTVLTVK